MFAYSQIEIDRSPTGTGTAGRVAQLYARGKLGKKDVLLNKSIIGTRFRARVLEETKVGDVDAVIAEVSGQAFITGLNQWVIDPEDPVAEGFFLR